MVSFWSKKTFDIKTFFNLQHGDKKIQQRKHINRFNDIGH